MSNFSFCHNVSKSRVLQKRQKTSTRHVTLTLYLIQRYSSKRLLKQLGTNMGKNLERESLIIENSELPIMSYFFFVIFLLEVVCCISVRKRLYVCGKG